MLVFGILVKGIIARIPETNTALFQVLDNSICSFRENVFSFNCVRIFGLLHSEGKLKKCLDVPFCHPSPVAVFESRG